MIERALGWFVALFFVRVDSDLPSYLMSEYRNETEIDVTDHTHATDPLWNRLRRSNADGHRLADESEESAAD